MIIKLYEFYNNLESGRLEFDEFVTLAAKFIVEEDDEAMQKELREAFRLYDKEGMFFFDLPIYIPINIISALIVVKVRVSEQFFLKLLSWFHN